MGKPVNPMAHVRCVLVGNAFVGKTSLIVAYTTNGFCDRYKATAFDNYSVTVSVDNKPLKLDLCDTAGRSEFDSLRPLSYAEANVFLLCFNVMEPQSFESITNHWLPEIRAVSPNAAVIFVGTKSDLRMNMSHVMELQRKGASPACPKTIRRAAEQLRIDYIECSALTKHNLKEVFDLAILHGLRHSSALCAGVPPSPLQQRRFLSSSQEKAKTATTSFKEGFRKFVTMTKRLI